MNNTDRRDNKDHIINLRVSQETYEKIKQKARETGETVSNLVRNAIGDGAEIISDLSSDIFGPAGGKKKDFGDVVSYHQVEVAKDVKCARCDKEIPAAATATVGETGSGRKYYFCGKCRG